MKDYTNETVLARLEDKAERDPNLLRGHLFDDDAEDASIAAFAMMLFPAGSDAYQGAQDAAKRIFSLALDDYITANYQSELAELEQEMADNEIDVQREAQREPTMV